MRKVKLIYNPSSGETRISDHLDKIIELYQSEGFIIVPHRLDFKMQPESITYDLASGYDHVLVAGGDGTVNYIVNLLKIYEVDLPLGILATGTANDFAATVGMTGHDILRQCKAIIDGQSVRVDLGKANDRYFANVFSCGLFTDISQKTPTFLKNTFGKLAYYAEGLGELPRFRRMNIRIESDGGDYEGSCIIFFVFNGRTAGRLRIAYLSEIDDGKLDILIARGDNPFSTMRTIFSYLSKIGLQGGYPSGITHIRCSRLHAECLTEESTDIDGQPGPSFPLDITCEKGALNIIKPNYNI